MPLFGPRRVAVAPHLTQSQQFRILASFGIVGSRGKSMPFWNLMTMRRRILYEFYVRTRETRHDNGGSMKIISRLTALSRIAALLLVIGGVVHAATQDPGSRQAKATFAGGCFWCMEPPYDELEGVISTISGYIGGTKKNPTYEQVSAGTTGHAEAVQVTYDPTKITFQKLLDVFWRNIDPLTANAQFCDSGSQYRSAIFYHDETQKALAEKSKSSLQPRFKRPIVTQIVPAAEFYPAEDYHQDYYKKNPVRYKIYRYGCGRDQRLNELWGSEKAPTH
jgi:peptide-methionine (S)-S-oxide reductase